MIDRFLRPHPGYFGTWSEYSNCDNSFATGVEMEIFDKDLFDDRGATNFAMICCDETRLEGSNTDLENR